MGLQETIKYQEGFLQQEVNIALNDNNSVCEP
jgi:hypothetical protein